MILVGLKEETVGAVVLPPLAPEPLDVTGLAAELPPPQPFSNRKELNPRKIKPKEVKQKNRCECSAFMIRVLSGSVISDEVLSLVTHNKDCCPATPLPFSDRTPYIRPLLPGKRVSRSIDDSCRF